jgi:prefoldin subunit 5
MTTRLKSLPFVILVLVVFSVTAGAQTSGADTSTERVANQIGMLRQTVQALDATLNDIADKLLPIYAKAKDESADSVNRLSVSVTLLTQTEQRAETLRKQLLELIEKETSYRSRITQIEEDMRPDNVERALNPIGTTRTVEARETRRRILESDRRGFESLLTLTSQSRIRLEEDVRQADAMVSRLRQRLFPAIDRQIEKINPNNP